jgi:hypothetical protein
MHQSGASLFLLALGCARVSGLALPSLHAFNTRNVLTRQADNNYRIVVYQNAQCTGQQIAYSGDADACTNGLGAGGAGFQLLALDADGQLSFYDAVNCGGNLVDTFNPDNDQTGTDCKPLMGNPISFEYLNV